MFLCTFISFECQVDRFKEFSSNFLNFYAGTLKFFRDENKQSCQLEVGQKSEHAQLPYFKLGMNKIETGPRSRSVSCCIWFFLDKNSPNLPTLRSWKHNPAWRWEKLAAGDGKNPYLRLLSPLGGEAGQILPTCVPEKNPSSSLPTWERENFF